jgi:hypothetical protein
MFKKRMLTDRKDQSYKRALLFVDNSGADVVLGMLPLARELLRHGTEVWIKRADRMLAAEILSREHTIYCMLIYTRRSHVYSQSREHTIQSSRNQELYLLLRNFYGKTFFFEYAGELRIIILRRKRGEVLKTSYNSTKKTTHYWLGALVQGKDWTLQQADWRPNHRLVCWGKRISDKP